MAGQVLPTAVGTLGDKPQPVLLVQPAAAQVLRMGATRWFAQSRPRIQQIAPQPQLCADVMDVQRGQGFAAFGAGGDGELMLAQVFQFAIQSVMATGPQPERGVMAVASLGAEVELDRQLQVMHAVAVTQQHVQLAQCVPFATDRQVGRQQFDPGGMPHGKLP
ncbi:hypothetical protein D3C72_1885190 [compost metagenome]